MLFGAQLAPQLVDVVGMGFKLSEPFDLLEKLFSAALFQGPRDRAPQIGDLDDKRLHLGQQGPRLLVP